MLSTVCSWLAKIWANIFGFLGSTPTQPEPEVEAQPVRVNEACAVSNNLTSSRSGLIEISLLSDDSSPEVGMEARPARPLSPRGQVMLPRVDKRLIGNHGWGYRTQ
eukprot:s948_g15.t1